MSYSASISECCDEKEIKVNGWDKMWGVVVLSEKWCLGTGLHEGRSKTLDILWGAFRAEGTNQHKGSAMLLKFNLNQMLGKFWITMDASGETEKGPEE